MPPQFQSQPTSQTTTPIIPEPKKSHLKIILMIVIIVILILAGGLLLWRNYNLNKISELTVSLDEIKTGVYGDTTNWKTYTNEKYGFEIKYPPDFVFEENSDGAVLVAFYVPNGAIEGNGTKIYAEHSNFQTFDDFVQDMKKNRTFEEFKVNNKSVPDEQAREEAKKFDAQYPFEIMKINNADVLKHTSPFAFGLVDTDIYIWVGKGDYLSIYTDNNLDLNSFKFISTSTDQTSGINTGGLAYKTKEICESSTEKKCDYQMCIQPPSMQVCKINFEKGWYPVGSFAWGPVDENNPNK